MSSSSAVNVSFFPLCCCRVSDARNPSLPANFCPQYPDIESWSRQVGFATDPDSQTALPSRSSIDSVGLRAHDPPDEQSQEQSKVLRARSVASALANTNKSKSRSMSVPGTTPHTASTHPHSAPFHSPPHLYHALHQTGGQRHYSIHQQQQQQQQQQAQKDHVSGSLALAAAAISAIASSSLDGSRTSTSSMTSHDEQCRSPDPSSSGFTAPYSSASHFARRSRRRRRQNLPAINTGRDHLYDADVDDDYEATSNSNRTSVARRQSDDSAFSDKLSHSNSGDPFPASSPLSAVTTPELPVRPYAQKRESFNNNISVDSEHADIHWPLSGPPTVVESVQASPNQSAVQPSERLVETDSPASTPRQHHHNHTLTNADQIEQCFSQADSDDDSLSVRRMPTKRLSGDKSQRTRPPSSSSFREKKLLKQVSTSDRKSSPSCCTIM
ncbi:uncharacterized protein V1516DRAFT_683471 [Lipomyces oligophaga]|uniref:uncharacterized protein n=1 Tax=Lipomyces oligophaga TaxID=45792 RepID=UPI0034CFFBF3